MILKKSDIFNFNVDEIEIYGTFSNYKKLLEGINSSNSDFIIFEGFTLKKSDNLRDYEFKVDFYKNNLPCFAFYIGKKLNTKIKTRDYFKVYGSAFQIIELSEIIDFIDIYIELDYVDKRKGARNNTLKRFDLAIDLTKEIIKIVNSFNELTQKGSKYFGNKGEIETYYIGEYTKRLNRGVLIRIYDKIKDIKKKEKQSLYPDYLLEDNITRIEIEFRNDVVRFVNLNQLLDRSYIFNLFIKYLEKHTDIFSKVKTEDVDKLKRLNKKIDLNELTYNQIVRNKYISSFLGYGKTLLKIGACPVDILIKNLIISDLTKKDLSLGIKNNEFDIGEYISGVTIRGIKQIFSKQNNNKI